MYIKYSGTTHASIHICAHFSHTYTHTCTFSIHPDTLIIIMHTKFFFFFYISEIVHSFCVFFTVNSSVRLKHLSLVHIHQNIGPVIYISAGVFCVQSPNSLHYIKQMDTLIPRAWDYRYWLISGLSAFRTSNT